MKVMPNEKHGAVKVRLGLLSLVPVKKTKGERSMVREERVVIVYMKRQSSANDKGQLCKCEVKLNSSFRAILSVV